MSKGKAATPATEVKEVEQKDIKAVEEVVETPAETAETEELTVIESSKPKPKAKVTKPEAKEVKAEKEKEADPIMDPEFDPAKTYIFRSNKPGFRQLIPSEAVVWDPVTKSPKKIVLTDTEESPFADDHSEYVKPSRKQLSLVKGELRVKGTDIPRLRYLLAYDGFAGKETTLPTNRNMKGLYYLVDQEAIETKELEIELKKTKAKQAILDSSERTVEDFVLSRGKNIFGSKARLEALKIAGIAPDLVLSSLDNPVVAAKGDIVRASYRGHVTIDTDKILGTKGQILFAGKGRDVLEEAAQEIVAETEKGSVLLKAIVA